jgi:hypothetical protein
VTSSLTAESPTIRSFKTSLVSIGILTTRVLRARKARKSLRAGYSEYILPRAIYLKN